MDLQIKIFNAKRGEMIDEGIEIEEAMKKLGWDWYGSGYNYEDGYRELVFRRKRKGKTLRIGGKNESQKR